MIIQCRKCNSNYKIDPQKIPSGRSFVRCAKCSEAIPIARKEQGEVVHERLKRVIQCDQCSVKYAIPLSYFKGDTIKVHCGKCGHVFRVSKNKHVKLQTEDSLSPAELKENDRIKPKLLGDEDIEIGSLFDDIVDDPLLPKMEQQNRYKDSGGKLFEGPQTPTEKYLDAIKLDLDDTNESSGIGLGTISSDQKHKFFLDHTSTTADQDISQNAAKGQPNWPEIQDEVPFLDLLDEKEKGGNSHSEKTTERVKDNLEKKSQGQKHKVRELIIATMLLVLLLTGGYWIYWFTNNKPNPETEESTPNNSISILEPLQGKLIDNKSYPKPFFVLNGVIKSNFPLSANINRVTIKGLLYKKQSGQYFAVKKTVAGTGLTLSELKRLSKEEIKKKQEMQLRKGAEALKFTSKTLPFQVVFFDILSKNHKMEAKLISYYKGNKKYQL